MEKGLKLKWLIHSIISQIMALLLRVNYLYVALMLVLVWQQKYKTHKPRH